MKQHVISALDFLCRYLNEYKSHYNLVGQYTENCVNTIKSALLLTRMNIIFSQLLIVKISLSSQNFQSSLTEWSSLIDQTIIKNKDENTFRLRCVIVPSNKNIFIKVFDKLSKDKDMEINIQMMEQLQTRILLLLYLP